MVSKVENGCHNGHLPANRRFCKLVRSCPRMIRAMFGGFAPKGSDAPSDVMHMNSRLRHHAQGPIFATRL
jgi:hypothetical protein